MKLINHLRFSQLLLLIVAALPTQAANVFWNGGSLVPTNLWSDVNNWDTLTVPTTGDVVTFTNAGSTDLLGTVNNVVDSNLTIATLNYKAQVSFVSFITNYHTTLINPGVTLTIDNGATAGALLNSGDTDPAIQDNQYFYTITGAGTVIAGNTNAPVATQGLQASATSTALTNHIGVLDLSGLDNFTFAGGYVWVGASAANAAGATDRPNGKMYLARTNFIIANSTSTDGSFRVGESKGNTPPRESQLELGQENTIYTTYMKIGGLKDGPSAGGRLYFRTSLTNDNPTLKLRGADGISRVTTLGIGENTLAGGSSIGTRGTVELSGGTFDALVGTANIGRSSSTATATGAASGTVNWTSGTFDITTLNLGYQSGNTTGSATGTLNVRGTNANLIAGTIVMGRDGGAATGRGIATLNITGGTATVVNTISENNATGGNGTSTINLTNGWLNVGGVVDVDNINLNNGSISNSAMITVSSLKGVGQILGPVMVLTNFNPGAPVGLLTLSNSLDLSATSTSLFEMDLDTLSVDQVVGLTTVTYGGKLIITNTAGLNSATNGLALRIFEAATYAGTFNSIELPTLSPGLGWDTTSIAVDGKVRIVATVNTTPTNMVFQLTGNTLDLSWPADRTGWRLEGQTNGINVGITTNWFPIDGSAGTNRVVLTIDTNGTVFYRLVYP